jgi:hypothetical protein
VDVRVPRIKNKGRRSRNKHKENTTNIRYKQNEVNDKKMANRNFRGKKTVCEEEDWLGERELELLCGQTLLEESI